QPSNPLAPIQDMVRTCIQCGTCTGSCPNAFAMDYTPRKMWRMVLMGKKHDIFSSKTFTMCSSCYHCTLRCPRGLPLTEAIGALKRIALKEHLSLYRQSTLFCRNFMDSVRRHGRVREIEFMTQYFFSMKNPFTPIRFAPLGMKLMTKRRVSLRPPSKGHASLEAIFRKAKEVEEQ
ncbi:MAG: 4Fe-4S dicluster domain-containing protein, partial [Thermodesulfobacteriota bacterium]|nr:4Fe-4S dicluster domain-containing protein [Thermodesulfobacteriota bacterium]